MGSKRPASELEHADHRITTAVNKKRDTPAMRLVGAVSEIGDQPQMRLLCAATIAAGVIRRDRRLAATGVRMLAAHTIATWGKGRIKAVVDRRRPDSGDDPRVRHGRSDRHEDNAFPSGHSAGVIAVGESFARAYPACAAAARAAAIAVSIVQVPRGRHYVGDVLAGMAIGLAADRLGNTVWGAARPAAAGSVP